MLEALIERGLMPCNLKTHKVVYESFINQKSKGEKTSQIITNLSEEFNIPESSLYRIIKKMRTA